MNVFGTKICMLNVSAAVARIIPLPHSAPIAVSTDPHLVLLRDVLEHVLQSPQRGVAVAVVPPLAGRLLRRRRGSVGHAAAHQLLAVGVRPLQVVRVQVGVGKVQDSGNWEVFLGTRE